MIKDIEEDAIEDFIKHKKIGIINEIHGVFVPYVLQKRIYGEGELRLGTSIDLDPTIYSYAYGLCICDEDITDFMDLLTGVVHEKKKDDGD